MPAVGDAIQIGTVRSQNWRAPRPAQKKSTLSSASATVAESQSIVRISAKLSTKAVVNLATGFTR
jgi:hypothetical protein